MDGPKAYRQADLTWFVNLEKPLYLTSPYQMSYMHAKYQPSLKLWKIFEVKDGRAKSLEWDPTCSQRVLHFSTYEKCMST